MQEVQLMTSMRRDAWRHGPLIRAGFATEFDSVCGSRGKERVRAKGRFARTADSVCTLLESYPVYWL